MKIQKTKFSLFFCLAFIFGIALASFLPFNFLEKDIWYFIGAMSFFVLTILFWKNQKIFFVSLVGLFFFLGIWRYSLNLPVSAPDKIWFYNNTQVDIQGIINKEPDRRDSNQKIEIEVESLNGKKVSGKVLVTANVYPEFAYGDKLKIVCELETPEEFDGFAYDRYLARYDIYSVCYYPMVKRMGSGQGSRFYALIFRAKDILRNTINQNMTEPEAGLARAIVLGDKQGVSENLKDTFSQTGISHIVAISGMHIAILSVIFFNLILGLGLNRRVGFYLVSFFLFFYIMLIGFPASAVRAGIMGFLVLLALHIGRLNRLINSLFFTAAVLLLFNPKLLRADIGFQLSFLAVFGIAWLYPKFKNFLEDKKVPKFFGARDIFLVTLTAQVFTLPIIAFNFSQISLIAPLTNLLVLWMLPFLLISILIAIFLSFLFPPLGIVFFLPSKIILLYIIYIAQFLNGLPLSYIQL